MPDRDSRRWTRLRPESLTEARVGLVEGGHTDSVELVDLSPGGIAVRQDLHARTPPTVGRVLRVRLALRGSRPVVLPARVLHLRKLPSGIWRVAMAWLSHPPAWDQVERRDRPRLSLCASDGFSARLAVPHVHDLWTRVALLDLSSDRGMRIEGIGGPLWMLPGMDVELRLDIPAQLGEPIACQVLWVRPVEGGHVQAGLRVLDMEAPELEALDQWIVMARKWSPRDLLERSFRYPALPGQFRFRLTETRAEREELRQWLFTPATQSTTIGFEGLPPLPEHRERTIPLVGCWDGERLVAGIGLDTTPEVGTGMPDEVALVAAGFDPGWFHRQILRGLWNQALNIFLSSDRSHLRLWCPAGREAFFLRLGMRPISSEAEPPRSPGGWFALDRNTILHGSGMSAVSWNWTYGNISRFHARQGRWRPTWRQRIQRTRRLVEAVVLADLFEPRFRRRLRREMERWRFSAIGV